MRRQTDHIRTGSNSPRLAGRSGRRRPPRQRRRCWRANRPKDLLQSSESRRRKGQSAVPVISTTWRQPDSRENDRRRVVGEAAPGGGMLQASGVRASNGWRTPTWSFELRSHTGGACHGSAAKRNSRFGSPAPCCSALSAASTRSAAFARAAFGVYAAQTPAPMTTTSPSTTLTRGGSS